MTKWTEAEKRSLIKLVEKKWPYQAIADSLNREFHKGEVRTLEAIMGMIGDMRQKKVIPKGDVKFSNRVLWSQEEIAKAIELYNKNLSINDVSMALNTEFWGGRSVRTMKSVESQFKGFHKKGLIKYKRKIEDSSNFSKGILSQKLQNIMALKQQGVSDSDVAKKLNMPIGSVKSNLSYARVHGITSSNPSMSDEQLGQEILRTLKVKPESVGELSRKLDRSKETIVRVVDQLHGNGYDVALGEDSKQVTLSTAPTKKFGPMILENIFEYEFKIGIVSDTHLGSKYQQLSLLHTAYKEMEKEKVDFILHAGDFFDGMGMYKGQTSECFIYSAEDMLAYAIEHYPKLKTIKTYLIGGNHDFSTKKAAGYNIVRHLCEKREDLCYRGEMDALFQVKDLIVYMLHPSGGMAYSLSYRPQKIAENIIATSLDKMRTLNNIKQLPHVFLNGHFHKYITFLHGGTLLVSAPCFQAPTPYLITKGLSPDVGYVILHASFNKDWHLTKILPEMRRLNAFVKERDW